MYLKIIQAGRNFMPDQILQEKSFMKIWLSLIVFSFPIFFALWFLLSGQLFKMIREMSGSNKTWEWNEIWQAGSFFMALGSWGAMLAMVYLISAYDVKYPIEAWVVLAVNAAGSAGVEAFIVYIKGKYGKHEDK